MVTHLEALRILSFEITEIEMIKQDRIFKKDLNSLKKSD